MLALFGAHHILHVSRIRVNKGLLEECDKDECMDVNETAATTSILKENCKAFCPVSRIRSVTAKSGPPK